MPRIDPEGDRLWLAVFVFLLAFAVAGLLSIDDLDGQRPTAPEYYR